MATAIFRAILKNDEAAFDKLVQDQPSMIQKRDKKNHGESVLHLVTRAGHKEFAKKIIGTCPSLVYSTDDNGDTPLHVAATCGRKIILVQMLEFGLKSVTPGPDSDSEVENHEIATEPPEDDLKLAELKNNNGLTPIHFAAISGIVKILKVFCRKTPSSFNILTLPKNQTVFHLAVINQNIEAFEFMAKKVELVNLLHQLDRDGNTVLHTAASVGNSTLMEYIINNTKVDAKAKNADGYTAAQLLDKDNANFTKLSTLLTSGKKTRKEEALQTARNTIIVVAIFIATLAYAAGINPPGGVYQDGDFKGTAIAGKTLAYKLFSVSSSIALYTSIGVVILLVSLISFEMKPLKKLLVVTYTMMSVAMAAISTSFVSAGWVILPHFDRTTWLLYTTLGIAAVMVGGAYVYLCSKLAIIIYRKIYPGRTPVEEAATKKGYGHYISSLFS
uniref:Ankyrin repeat-containing protein n=1 Tax=Noccaea caerulescens TaxID=107243 RepID=A0A1J3CV85_NOCCA